MKGPLTLTFCSTFILVGCNESTAPSNGPAATLQNIWPNEDGSLWRSAITWKKFENVTVIDPSALYDEPGLVPPAPSIDAILPYLDHPSYPDSVSTLVGEWCLHFEGDTTTSYGVTVQNLQDSMSLTPGVVIEAPQYANSFPGLLGYGRPVLRSQKALEIVPEQPFFLHGGPWEKSEEWIGLYDELGDQLAWKYLDKNLSQGHEFVHKLIPTLKDDVYLRARVRRIVAMETKAGVFRDVLEVVYLLDRGLVQVTEIGSVDPYKSLRVIDYGRVFFAPTVGPIASYERLLNSVGETLGPGRGEISMELIGWEPGPSSTETLGDSKGRGPRPRG